MQADIPSHNTAGVVTTLKENTRVAVVVLVTAVSGPKWEDAFAIFSFVTQRAFAQSAYQLELIAITSETTSGSVQSFLQSCGFNVRALPPPIKLEEVQTEYARMHLQKGCCGEVENFKLYGVAFTEFHRVIVVDADIMFLHHIDELLHDSTYPLSATYDHGLDNDDLINKYSAIPPVNGGFLVITPNRSDYDGIIATLRAGDFRPGSAWGGKRVGWAYGGAGPQGLLAYYYSKGALAAGAVMKKKIDLPGNITVGPPGTRIKALDRSKYDVLDTPQLRQAIDEGSASIDDVRVFHFTADCLKPWECTNPRSKLCIQMTDSWWKLREEYAQTKKLEVTPRCKPGRRYEALKPLTS